DTSTTSILGSVSNAMPGSLCRFGPANVKGEARIDHTGSTRRFTPEAWISQLACPTKDSLTLSPVTLGGGVSAWGLGTQSGQDARRRPEPNCQRSSSRSDFGGEPSGSKKCWPLK